MGLFVKYLSYLPEVSRGEVIYTEIPWVSNLGIDLAFRLDGLSLLFALLITGIGTMVVLYSIFYLRPHKDFFHGFLPQRVERLGNFYVFLFVFMGAMLGVVTADNLIILYIFWELTSTSSFLLIGYWFDKDASRYGAQRALFVTIIGGLALLVGFILLGQAADTFSISQILAHPEQIKNAPLYPVIAILIMIGAFAKSAQVPFHIWLPTAMEAPTPISCYLHSATMVKAGIFLLARLTPVLGNSHLWQGTIVIVGISSLLFGSFMALRKTDLKAILAYSTISQLGLIVCLVGIGTKAALLAAMFHLFNHSAFKGSLFLMTGIVDHQTDTRDIAFVSGLGKVMPVTAGIAFIGSLSMAGLPPFSGFLSKELFITSVAEAGQEGLSFFGSFTVVLTIVAVIASLFTFVYSLTIFGKAFTGKLKSPGEHPPHEASPGLLIPACALVLFNVVVAIFPNVFGRVLIAPAAETIAGVPVESHIAFWHGFNLPLLLTLIIFAGGAILFANAERFKPFILRLKSPIGAEKAYEWAVPRIYNTSGRVTDFYMRGSLRNYTALTMLAFILLTALPLTIYSLWGNLSFDNLAPVTILEIVMVLVAMTCAFAVTRFRRPLFAVLSLGGVGATVSFFFVVFRAPDLALTQLLVEICSTVLFLMALRMMPERMDPNPPTRPIRRKLNAIVSISLGALVAFLSYWGHSNKSFSPISWFYSENSYTRGGGHNVVNVTLIDFRGLDTMGEITVLSIATVGVLMLVNLVPKERSLLRPTHKHGKLPLSTNNVILYTTLQTLALIILVTSLFIFWKGHNAPGGGFIAGLMFSGAVLLIYLVRGRLFRGQIDVNYKMLLPIGLSFAVGCGLGGVFFGEAFLSHTFGYFHVPFFGEIELATATIFDFGVFLVVIGTVLSIVTNIGKGQEDL
ncbi:MAG: DUF4040 domain-containing protein [Clostridiales Family XIII bacterium]|nr:DUF4040 domain-containing protein [Clostridiales Family XIII bacterium]